MQTEKFKQSDNQATSSSGEKKPSSCDFAVGKTYKGILKRNRENSTIAKKDHHNAKKQVKFKENLEEGHPVSKYRDYEDREIPNEMGEPEKLAHVVEDAKDICGRAMLLYKELFLIDHREITLDLSGTNLENFTSKTMEMNKSLQIYDHHKKSENHDFAIESIKDLPKQTEKMLDILSNLEQIKAHMQQIDQEAELSDQESS